MTSTRDPSTNLAEIMDRMEEAAGRSCDLVAFPENALLISDDKKAATRFAMADADNALQLIRAAAKHHRIWVLLGSLPRKVRGTKKLHNTSVLIDQNGKIQAEYSKIHLFDVHVLGDRSYRESEQFTPGKTGRLASTPLGKLGMSICYDLRFPELYRAYSAKGATILSIPSAFTFPTGRAHWDALTRARAIENQCFVIAPAQSGTHESGRKTYGHSRIVSPWGEILAEKKSGKGLVIAELSQLKLQRVRKHLPSLRHRLLIPPKIC